MIALFANRAVVAKVLALLLGQLAISSVAVGQVMEEEPILVGDSGVGYIDSAVLGDQVRLRYESAYDINRPNRAEFLWAWPPSAGNGPPLAESSTDYQSLSAYLEKTWTENVSGFVELAGLLVNPEINDNTGGLGDINLGCKLAMVATDCQLTTLQMRVYVPTGDESRALGTGHVSLEPSLLHYRRLNSIWTSESELRYFAPIGGTEDRRGPVTRYGTGLSCLLWESENVRISPVTEFVGWTVLDGKSTFLDPAGGTVIEDATGDTIVNGKFGIRFSTGANSLYVGYGHALTGDRWYEDVLRIDFRRTF
jgi:hypothetical protein